ncbi:methyl-accepting chemotaxis protein [Clostridium sp. OS1-26]|uniref:methyl-accepting chemotaxis protein n=1 Tax=Clostridium sp. OS1-26 TaxID=3070681 RepID=UPI0027E11A40|nr:methyl-accepting chemotaxis protein [Clostridium sp. OS1-26]WML33048.1 methyl-accepting chemotaxis protein [Clostridium sp. OS1-26]
MNIVVVGAGHGGCSIIQSLSNISDIKIKTVVDRDMDASGIKLAKQLGITCLKSIDDISCDNIDIILEVTGSENVSRILFEKFSDKTTILNSKAALLITTLVKKDIETLEKLNKSMEVINDTSSVIQKELKDISTSVKDIHNVSDTLVISTKNSNEYITKTDEIIKYVEKMTKYTKILGLNAAIQAARAGEQGKGFSVVATEIQKLAESTRGFSEEISKILNQLSGEIKNIKEESNKLNSLSELQVTASNKVNNAVDKLVNETS